MMNATEQTWEISKAHEGYLKAGAPRIAAFGPLPYLCIEGRGAPEGAEFQEATSALYAVAFTAKMARKPLGAPGFKVSPLEGQWWSDFDPPALDERDALWTVPRDAWRWRLLIALPPFVSQDEVCAAAAQAARKRPGAPVDRVGLETIDEGRCVQALHVGPYATEPETIAAMRSFMREQRLAPTGLHHEIYLGDPRRAAPEKLRTILRQPIA